MRLLLIESDLGLAQQVEAEMKAAGHAVILAEDYEDGADLAKRYDYEAAIIGDGCLAAIRVIRKAQVLLPIVVLSRDVRISSKIRALDGGADDYLVCPCDWSELLARLRAVARRAVGHAASEMTYGNLRIRLDKQAVSVDGRPLWVIGHAYRLLELLAMRRGAVVSKSEITDYLYGGDAPASEAKIIDIWAMRLRRKLEAAGSTARVETSWGRGFRLSAPEDAVLEAAE